MCVCCTHAHSVCPHTFLFACNSTIPPFLSIPIVLFDKTPVFCNHDPQSECVTLFSGKTPKAVSQKESRWYSPSLQCWHLSINTTQQLSVFNNWRPLLMQFAIQLRHNITPILFTTIYHHHHRIQVWVYWCEYFRPHSVSEHRRIFSEKKSASERKKKNHNSTLSSVTDSECRYCARHILCPSFEWMTHVTVKESDIDEAELSESLNPQNPEARIERSSSSSTIRSKKT